jgi:FkbM family methyltransferase
MNYKTRHLLVNKLQDTNIKGTGLLSRMIIKITPKPKHAMKLKTIYGFSLGIDPVKDKGVELNLFYTGTYEKGTLHIIGKILNEGDVFVDIGANIGLMSIFASYKVGEKGQVIAFEPNPSTNKILKENIALNNITNIKVESFALSNEKKKGKIYENIDLNRGSASLIKLTDSTAGHDINEITVYEYFQNFANIDLIKIDVEGYELKVMEGAKKYIENVEFPPMLIVEFSSMRENSFGKETEQLASYIKALGYKLFKSKRGKERIAKLVEIKDKKDLPIHDNVYCFTNSHLAKIDADIFDNNA